MQWTVSGWLPLTELRNDIHNDNKIYTSGIWEDDKRAALTMPLLIIIGHRLVVYENVQIQQNVSQFVFERQVASSAFWALGLLPLTLADLSVLGSGVDFNKKPTNSENITSGSFCSLVLELPKAPGSVEIQTSEDHSHCLAHNTKLAGGH